MVSSMALDNKNTNKTIYILSGGFFSFDCCGCCNSDSERLSCVSKKNALDPFLLNENYCEMNTSSISLHIFYYIEIIYILNNLEEHSTSLNLHKF